MLTKEILKGNILIAKFMGWRVEQREIIQSSDWYYAFKPNMKNACSINACWSVKNPNDFWEIIAQKFDYSKNWNYLMPAVIKMANTKEYEDFHEPYAWPYMEGNPISCFCTNMEYDTNFSLETLWKELVDFIQWYNTQKK